MYKQTDVLALGAALEKLDPAFTIADLNALLKAGDNKMQGSIEGVFDGLRRALAGPNVERLPIGDVSSSAASRTTYHATLADLQDNPIFKDLAGQLRIKPVSQSLASLARTDFGALVALQDLSPLYIGGTTASANDELAALWQSGRAADYAGWQADRTASNPATFSDNWLADRTALLMVVMQRNQTDAAGILPGSRNLHYIDVQSGTDILVGAGASNEQRVQYLFGGNNPDMLEGKGFADHLYGGAGADTLDGKGGADYLEGGAGKDVYRFNGQFGNDTVWDADGSGTLEFDGVAMPLATVKRYGSDDAWEDASGQFLFTRVANGQGGADLRITKYTSATDKTVQGTVTVRNYRAGAFGLTLAEAADKPQAAGGTDTSLVVLAAQPGDPTRAADRSTPPLSQSNGTLEYSTTSGADQWVYADDSNGGQTVATGAGNDRIFVGRPYESLTVPGLQNWGPKAGEDEDHVFAGAGDDVVLTGYGSDVIEGGDGNDYLFSAEVGEYSAVLGGGSFDSVYGMVSQNHDAADAGSSDFVDGGAGNDTIRAGMGGDVLFGGSGNDTISGMEGDDLLMGGEGADILYGDGVYTQGDTVVGEMIQGYTFRGNDTLMGEAGKDILTGGVGEDQLFGGDGDDQLFGDTNSYASSSGENLLWIPGQFHAADFLDGGEGNDFLLGGGGADVLLGGRGNDTIYGDQYSGDRNAARYAIDAQYHGNDLIDGGDGEDTIFADGGDDTVEGGAGNDRLSGGDGNDILVGGTGFDVLDGGLGNDVYRFAAGDFEGANETIVDAGGVDRIEFMSGLSASDLTVRRSGDLLAVTFAGQGGVGLQGGAIESLAFADGTVMTSADLLAAAVKTTAGDDELQTVVAGSRVDGGAGNDKLSGDEWADVLLGGAGNDVLRGGGGDDLLDGGAGDDLLYAGATGAAVLIGGAGRDFLYGYESDTTYRFGVGSGQDYIEDSGGIDTIELGTGIAPADVTIRNGNRRLTMALSSGETLEVANMFNADGNLRQGDAIEFIRFADGTVWNQEQIMARALLPTAGADAMWAFAGDDAVHGGDGDDTIYGNDGNDTLMGDAGDDRLDGGNGDDQIVGGAGQDEMSGGAGNDVYVFAPGDDAGVISRVDDRNGTNTVRLTGGALADMRLNWSDEEGRWTLRYSRTDTVQLSGDFRVEWNGQTYAMADFAQAIAASNQAPVISHAIATQNATEDAAWSFTVPLDTFADPEGAAMVWSARAADGGPLPSWMRFDAATRTFSGTPTGDDSGVRGLQVVVKDPAGASAQINFELRVAAVNDAPVATGTLAAQTFKQGAAWEFWLPPSMFYDEDYDDVLTYSATLTDGSALPSWLSFDPVQEVFRTTGTSTPAGTVNIALTATDKAGAKATHRFAVTVQSSTITGTASNDTLTGTSGNDTLDGGAGADTMTGLGGDDTYVVDNASDKVVEAANAGIDTVLSSVTYTLAANVENLTLTGTAAINGTGNALANALVGNAGANRLDGGTGADAMTGGAGNDVYVVDNAGDTVIEAANGGTDAVESSITHTLAANVENLTLTGTAAINGTGNALANTLTGNSGANRLDGGAGADAMSGGAGNDVYVVDNAGDTVIEAANGGTDAVESSITHTLAANVENLTLTGTAAINGTGNALANTLTGNSGANRLDGGAGADAMGGGAGDDVYVVDNASDTVTEGANGGTDTVESSIAYTLGSDVENLTLTGSSALNGTGNALNNRLLGNAGANTLTGGAGADYLDGAAGADTLVGGLGNDTYWLGRGYGLDTIQENDSTSGNQDIAKFANDISSRQLWFRKSGNNLEVSVIGTNDKFMVTDWYSGTKNQVERFDAGDGKSLTNSQVQNLVQAMASFSPPAAGQTTLPANYQSGLESVLAANWK
ncbi:putative Ig domain-containing protein [Acidovorax sp. SUPP1855]|nr:putative Ig domain-containing protein [Acidovorax sp. SUPP1855]